ncbi:MAG: winged helix-turn-helix transcriptional regulator [Actinobacteria bacterium]|nr:MAG: winged helix-turn-helix transcriptional regulator [Actinomycetota bacterium]
MSMKTRTTAPAVVLITRLSRVIYRYVDEGALGMTLKQFSMLNYLRDFDGTTQSALADIMCVDANMVVQLLNGLEDRGFAVRERDPNDRRRHIVRITPAGVKALVRGDRAVAAATEDALGALDADERAELGALLAKALGDGALEVSTDG